MKCVALLFLAFFSVSPLLVSAHDLTGLVEEASDPIAKAVADPEAQLRIRISQMTGREVVGQEIAADEFGRAATDDVEQIFLRNYRWDQRRILRICFFDGSPAQRQSVTSVIDEIISHTNLGAMISTTSCPVRNADIQILFSSNGCFSYYGKMALTVLNKDRNAHTMGLCRVSGRTETELGTIRHELMHALGAVHEQQHDDERCYEQLDLKKVGQRMFGRLTSDERTEAIKTNILGIRQSVPNAEISQLPYDKLSNLHYRLDRDLFKDPNNATCVLAKKNNRLSSGDKRILSMMYPPTR